MSEKMKKLRVLENTNALDINKRKGYNAMEKDFRNYIEAIEEVGNDKKEKKKLFCSLIKYTLNGNAKYKIEKDHDIKNYESVLQYLEDGIFVLDDFSKKKNLSKDYENERKSLVEEKCRRRGMCEEKASLEMALLNIDACNYYLGLKKLEKAVNSLCNAKDFSDSFLNNSGRMYPLNDGLYTLEETKKALGEELANAFREKEKQIYIEKKKFSSSNLALSEITNDSIDDYIKNEQLKNSIQ